MSNLVITASLFYEEPIDYSNLAQKFNEYLIKSGIGSQEQNVNDLNCTYTQIPKLEDHLGRQLFVNNLMECKLDYELYKDDKKILDLMKERKLKEFNTKINNNELAIIYSNKQIKYALSLDNNKLNFHLIYEDEKLTSDNSERIYSYRRRLFNFLNKEFNSKKALISKARYIDKVTGDYFKLKDFNDHRGYFHNERKIDEIELGKYTYKEYID